MPFFAVIIFHCSLIEVGGGGGREGDIFKNLVIKSKYQVNILGTRIEVFLKIQENISIIFHLILLKLVT